MGHKRIRYLTLALATFALPALAGANPEKASDSSPPREVVVGPQPLATGVQVIKAAPPVQEVRKEAAPDKEPPKQKPAQAKAVRLAEQEVEQAEQPVEATARVLVEQAEAAALSAAAESPEDPAEGVVPVEEAEAVTPAEGEEAGASARLEELNLMISRELDYIREAKGKVSLLVSPLKGDALVSWEADTARVPASNAKLLTTTAAALTLPGKYRFVTRVSVGRKGGPIYLSGTGDPTLRGHDIVALARKAKARGVRSVRGVVVDDSYFDRRRLAPGFTSFSDGSRFRPTSGAVNVDYNAVVIKVSAPKGRRHPRVDVFPPSDYVKVRKRVRFARARKGKAARQNKIRISRTQEGSIMWLTISGTMGRKARTHVRRLAVYDPGLNAGWALRRALKDRGVVVVGTVRKGRRPAKAKVVASREHTLGRVLARANQNSCNLAAENLVRAMGRMGAEKGPGDTWSKGLVRMDWALAGIGVSGFKLGNGSGLHRTSRVTASAMVSLLRKVYSDEKLRKRLLPTLAVAGKVGTLGRRMRGTPAEGYVKAKTGTLGNVLALSGLVEGEGVKEPLFFSLIVNGTARTAVRNRMDRIAELLARHARGMPLRDEVAMAR